MSKQEEPSEQLKPVQEREPISDEEAKKAYVAGDMEKFGSWVNQEQERQPTETSYGQMYFEKKLADIQVAAGQKEDAIERLNDLANRARVEYVALDRVPPGVSRDECARRYQEMREFEAACDEQVRELQK